MQLEWNYTKDPCFKEGEALHQGPLPKGGRGSTPKTPCCKEVEALYQSNLLQGCPRPVHNPRHFVSKLNLFVQIISISAFIESLEEALHQAGGGVALSR